MKFSEFNIAVNTSQIDFIVGFKGLQNFRISPSDLVGTFSSLNFITNSGSGTVDLGTQAFTIVGSSNQIQTSGVNQTITIGLTNDITINGELTVSGSGQSSFGGQVTIPSTPVAGTDAASKSYVDSQVTVQDLDFSGDSGNGSVDLDSQSLGITGTTNQVTTSATNQTLNISLPTTVHRNLQGDVTGNVTGDLTGNVTGDLTGNVTGNVTGNADTSTGILITADNTDTSRRMVFTESSNLTDTDGRIFKDSASDFFYNPSTNKLTVGTVNGNVIGDLTGDVTGNVSGDLTGNITATSVLADGVTGTTQSTSDNSTKIATTAYVDAQAGLADTLSEVLVGGNTTGATKIEVDNTSSGIDFIDNAKARFGTGNDLEIYHDGTDSYIDEVGTGNLKLRGGDAVQIYKTGTTEIMAEFIVDSKVSLYYDNSKKFETTSLGVSVTGDVTVTGELTVSGTGQSSFGGQVTIPATPSASTDAASKGYVDDLVTAQDLDITDGTNNSSVDLDSQTLTFTETANETTVVVSAQEVTIGLPNDVTISGTYTGTTFAGQLNGTISTNTTAITQAANNNSTKVATTEYVDTSAGNYLPLAGGTMGGNIAMGGNNISGGGTATFNSFVGALTGNASTASALFNSGDITLTGDTTSTSGVSYTSGGNVAINTSISDTTVTGKLITGVNLGTSQNIAATDTILEAFGYLQAQITQLPQGLVYSGTWNANTNTPTLASGTGTTGHFYIVSVAGSTNLDGITDWQVGDWAIFIESGATDTWQKIDNTSAITGTGTNNAIAKWTGPSTLGTGLITDDGTTVTIGNSGDLLVAGDGTITGNLSWGSLTDTGESITITKFVDEADGIPSNDNDTSIPTSAAVKNYVDIQIDNFDTLAEVLANGNTTDGNNIIFGDSGAIGTDDTLMFGAGNDLRIAHNGTDSVIRNFTGGLYFDQKVVDGDIYFRADNGSGGTTEYFRLDGSFEKTVFSKDIFLNDSVKALFGNSSDLQIYHDGSNSYINETGTGSLITQASDYFLRVGGTNNTNNAIVAANAGTVTLYYANSAKLATTSTGVTVTGNIDGVGNLFLQDYIYHSGDGDTYFGFPAANEFKVTVGNSTKMFADANAAYLYYQGSSKLQTTSSGVSVTGSIDITGDYKIDGNILIGTTSTYTIIRNPEETSAIFLGDSADPSNYYNNTSHIFRSAAGAVYLTINSSSATFAGDVSLPDDKKLLLGTGNDLQIYHDGSNSYINETGTGVLSIQSDGSEVQINKGASEYMGRFITDAGVKLYYDNSLKFETTSTGIQISDAGAVKKIVSYFDGDYTSGFKFSDLNGGIWYDAGADDLYLNANHANSQIILQSGGSTTLTLDASNNATFAGSVHIDTKANSGLAYNVLIDIGSNGDGTIGYQTPTQLVDNLTGGYNGLTFADGTEALDTAAACVIATPSRSSSPDPEDYQRSFSTEFKGKAASGSPGTGSSWIGLVSMSPYRPQTSGFYTTQLGFGADGTNGDMFIRRGTTTSWGDWRKFIISDSSGNTTFAGNVNLGDDKKLNFGALPDYEIYHNSTTNVNHISSLSDRQLSINANNIFLTNQANNANFLALNSTAATFSVPLITGDITALGADFILSHPAGGTMFIRRNDTTIDEGNVIGLINFQGDDPTDGTFNTGAMIRVTAAADWSSAIYNSDIEFHTRDTCGNLFKNLTVRADGGVAIGQNNDGYAGEILSVKSGSENHVLYGESTDANCFASFRDNASTNNIEYGARGNDHVLRKDTADYFIVNNVGDVYNYQSVNKANTYYGYDAGNYDGTGGSNNAFGYSALSDITTGTENVAIGRNAGHAITTASQCVLIGHEAGDALTTGGNNTVIGSLAFSAATGQTHNVVIGRAAGQLATCNQSILIGSDAGENLQQDENVFIGYKSGRVAQAATQNVGVGTNTLYTLSSGDYNTAIGHNAGFALTTGVRNTLVGYLAGDSLGAADSNTFIGDQAGATTTTSSQNVAIGCESLQLNVSGGNLTAIGYRSLKNNTGNYNTAGGFRAMEANTTGQENTSWGRFSLFSNVDGDRNTAVGNSALEDNTSGNNNQCFGYASFYDNTTGSENTGMGYLTGYENTTGAQNTYCGSEAGRNNVTSAYNTGIGYQALYYNTGEANVALGRRAGFHMTTGSSNVFIGYGAAAESSAGGAHSSNACVGIGRIALSKLQSGSNNTAVGMESIRQATSGHSSTAIGRSSLENMTSATQNTAVGMNAIRNATTGSGNIAMGYEAGDKITTGGSNIAIGYAANAGTTGTANLCIGDAAGFELTSGDNNILIGKNAGRNPSVTNSLAQETTGDNSIQIGNKSHTSASVNVAWTIVSDKRDKTNISNLDKGLDFINKLKPVSYERRKNRTTQETDNKKRYGFLAQDVLELEEENPVIVDNTDADNLKLTSDAIVPVLVNAIKELKAEIEILKSKN